MMPKLVIHTMSWSLPHGSECGARSPIVAGNRPFSKHKNAAAVGYLPPRVLQLDLLGNS